MEKIPEWLDDPALVFDSDTVAGRIVAIAPDLLDGQPVRIILEPDSSVNGLKVNLLVNAYDSTTKTPFKRWIDEGLLRYFNKTKSPVVLARSGLQLPSLAQARGRTEKILRDSDLVNVKDQYLHKGVEQVNQPRGATSTDLRSAEPTLTRFREGAALK